MASTTTTVIWQDNFTHLESVETPEFDIDLLMELLEEALPEKADDDRVEYIIRSLQAEIDSADPSKANKLMERGNIEDFLLVLDDCDEGRWFDWEEMDTRECYFDEVGDVRDDGSYCYQHAETTVQVYDPLW